MNKLIGVIKRKSAHLYFFLLFAVVFLIGEAVGAGLSTVASKTELDEFAENISFSTEHWGENPIHVMSQSAFSVLVLIFTLWLCAFLPKAVTVIIASVLIVYKGAAVGYTIGMLVKIKGFEGLWLSMLAILPQYILLLPLVFTAAVASLKFHWDSPQPGKLKKYILSGFFLLLAGLICAFVDGVVTGRLIYLAI